MSALMMRPICGVLVIVRRPPEDDFMANCWEEPGHDGPHVLLMLPAPTEDKR